MSATGNDSFLGNAAPAHPFARGIRSSLHSIDVCGWQLPARAQAPDLEEVEVV